jgi:pimeloyl-ACP methyl ester carboxylesterase
MSFITVQDGTNIFYKDWGPKDARTLVFHHGWPLSADDWDAQMMFFLHHGYRVIAHDRRGHGRSSQTHDGNEMDTYAADVAALTIISTCTVPFISVIPQAAARLPATLPGQHPAASPKRC